MNTLDGTVENNDDGNLEERIQPTVQRILRQLITHFRQRIHNQVLPTTTPSQGVRIEILSDDHENEHLEQELETPSVVTFWLDQLEDLSSSVSSQAIVELTEASRMTKVEIENANEKIQKTGHSGSLNHVKIYDQIIYEWIRGYETSIRPALFRSDRNASVPTFDDAGVSVLKYYYFIASKLLANLSKSSKEELEQIQSMPLKAMSSNKDSSDPRVQVLQQTILLLSTDVTLFTVIIPNVTANNNDGDGSEEQRQTIEKRNHLRRNEGLPTLLKLVGSAIQFTNHILTKSNDPSMPLKGIIQALRRCAVTLMAFETPTDDSFALYPHQLAPSLSTSNNDSKQEITSSKDVLRRLWEEFEREMGPSSQVETYLKRGIRNIDSLGRSLDDNFWKSASQVATPVSVRDWIDPNTPQLVQVQVRALWEEMSSLLSALESHSFSKTPQFSCTRQIVDIVQTLGGTGPFLADVRAHFFGRDMHGMEDLVTRQTENEYMARSVVVRMGKRVVVDPSKKNPFDGIPHETVPSRVAVAINAMRVMFQPQGCTENRTSILETCFPICATLVDSNQSVLSAMGAAGFCQIIEMLPSTPDHSAATANNLVCNHDECFSFAENTLSVLDRAFRSNSDSTAVVAIGHAQSKLLRWVLQQETSATVRNEDPYRFRRERRTVTALWLSNLEKSIHRRTIERQSLDFLLGGVLPLLAQHAMDDAEEADGMDVGRLGLAALLPLIVRTTSRSDEIDEFMGREDNIDQRTQLASIAALINLMFAAYPVMKSHGGKILSHLFVAAISAGEPTSDSENRTSTKASIRNLAIVAAAIALVICGSGTATAFIDSIENDREQYQPEFLEVMNEAMSLSECLVKRS